MPTQLTANFTLDEFRRASQREELTAAEERYAAYFAREVMQPIRNLTPWPWIITSFVRIPPNVGAGPHKDGRGVDIVPADRDRRKLEFMHALLSIRADKYGESLLELDHIHISYPGTDPRYPAGGPGQTLVENRPGTAEFNRYGRWRNGIVWQALLTPLALILLPFIILIR